MSGSVRNVFIENNKVGDVESALYVKSNSDRGGTVEGIWMRSNTVEVATGSSRSRPIIKGSRAIAYPSTYRNFHFEDLTCRNGAQMRDLFSRDRRQARVRDIF